MTWHLTETLDWQEPLALASTYAGHDMALLYSGIREPFTGQHSYLLLEPLETREGGNWADLPPLPASGDPLPLWVGYLGYGMAEAVDQRSGIGEDSPITLPGFRLVRYGVLYVFDHTARVVTRYHALAAGHKHNAGPASPLAGEATRLSDTLGALSRSGEGAARLADTHHAPSPKPSPAGGEGFPRVTSSCLLHSNLTRAQYESIVAETVEQIHEGQFYQANITRKFWGVLPLQESSFGLFTKLCAASPAPYAAYIAHGETAILSSSPECFLSVDAHGVMTTRPIKGSARRSVDEAEDKAIRDCLATSSKNHAENLMIVDLMRNDLAQVAEPTSVAVVEQSALYSYRTIHHLISTVRANKRTGLSVYDAVRACFPAGSMTGAPKIAAMCWCAAREGMARGVYSGAIGWFGAGDTCDLSVVIRTLIVQGNRFEFQVGGGIVADSSPEDEWRETLAKARGILAALGMDEKHIEAL